MTKIKTIKSLETLRKRLVKDRIKIQSTLVMCGGTGCQASRCQDVIDAVKNELDKPIMFTEFGSDAFNAVTLMEDQRAQAYYMVENWREIYSNAAGVGGAGNSIGGFNSWKYSLKEKSVPTVDSGPSG